MRGDIRGAAVSGVQPGGSRIRFFSGLFPCTGPCGYRHWGRRPAGRGNSFPLPCLSRSKHLASRCRHFCEGYPCTSASSPHPTRAFGAPPPPGGAWAVRGDIRGAAVSGVQPVGSRALDRGDIATGGGADGEGERVPPPLSLTLQTPCFSLPAFLRGIPRHFCRHPHPARAFGAPPPPPPGGAGSACDIR